MDLDQPPARSGGSGQGAAEHLSERADARERGSAGRNAGLDLHGRAARRERRAEVTDPDVVMAAAAGLLATRPWSVSELRRRLAALGYRADLVGTIIDRLAELGYLDDARYAVAWVESRDRSRPRGRMALRRELQRRGIEPAVIEAALAGREPTGEGMGPAQGPGDMPHADVLAAHRLLERRRAALDREPDPRRRRQRAYALLARNGFDPEVCAEVAARGLDDPTLAH